MPKPGSVEETRVRSFRAAHGTIAFQLGGKIAAIPKEHQRKDDNVKIGLRNYRCFQQAELDLSRRFTAIVGPNNAGKSALVRSIYEMRPLLQALATNSGNRNTMLMNGAVQIAGLGLTDATEAIREGCDEMVFTLDVGQGEARSLARVSTATTRSAPSTRNARVNWAGAAPPPRPGQFNFENNQYAEGGNSWTCEAFASACNKLARALYFPAFRNAINNGAGNHYDLGVGTTFVHTWHDWKTGNNKRQSSRIRQVTRDVQRLLGLPDLEVNANKDTNTVTLGIGETTYKLHEVGSGVAQLLICLAQAAISEPSYILIDEPELNLHPTLQVDFLLALAGYAQDGIVFSTHSLGLAYAVAEATYVCRQDKEGSTCTILERTPRYASFLGEMGLESYRAIGFNKVLLVEGVTEVRTVQQWLRLYNAAHCILVLPLGGTALIRGGADHELAEISRLRVDVFVLVDSERTQSDAPLDPGRQAFEKTCRDLGFDVHLTSLRATENYFTDAALARARLGDGRALAPYESLRSHRSAWAKSDNWRIAREMTRDELDGTDIGAFIGRLCANSR